MKQKLLFLLLLCTYPFCASSSTNNTLSSGMLEEGRTWWMADGVRGISGTSIYWEYGVSIGGEVEIGGVMWHELNVILSAKRTYDNGWQPWVYDDSERCISYIREDEHGDIFVYYDVEKLKNYPYLEYELLKQGAAWPFTEEDPVSHLYHHGAVGEAFTIGHQSDTYEMKIAGEEEVSSHGYIYNKYSYVYDGERYSPFNTEDVYYVEGIGYLSDAGDGELFFAPLRPARNSLPTVGPTRLRYVTSPGGEIIYERRGGMKLWEDFESAPALTVDSPEASVRWYNTQGVQVDAGNLTPGVYVKVSSNTATKVLVK